MNTQTQDLIELIKQNKSLNEISTILGLSNKQLFIKLSMLRNSGYVIDKNYYYNGEIKYSLSNPFKISDDTIYVTTPKDTSTIRVLLTSDTHLGNINDNIECIHNMTEYCIINNIHLVLNCGDFFDGIYPENPSNKISDSLEQIAYGLKNYPYDKNILNFVLLGNHDATFWLKDGIDIKTVLENRRHDIIPVDYGYGRVNIGGCQFRMQHPLSNENNKDIPKLCKDMIILKGHSHKFKVMQGNDNLSITVPCLSNVSAGYELNPIPSMIDMQLDINEGSLSTQHLQQFIFIDNKPVRISEIDYHVPINIINPKYEEEHKEVFDTQKEINTYQATQYKGMSQIEKFNARYGSTSKVLKK